MQTMTIDGQPVPVITSQVFLVDFGPNTGQIAKDTWLATWKLALNHVVAASQIVTVCPVDVLAWGSSGRTVLRVWAPDPERAVYDAEHAMCDGPKVVLL
jgi:hypothetical protein